MRTLRAAHHTRVEMASATGATGVDYFEAIRRCLADLERRGADTRNVTTFRFTRDPAGNLVAAPRLTIAAARLQMRQRRLREQKSEF